MKKILGLGMLAAVSALSIVSCNKEIENNEVVGNKVQVKVSATFPETKSYFGDKVDGAYPSFWTGDENLFLSLNEAAAIDNENIAIEKSDDGKTLTAYATFVPDGTTSGTIYAASPRGTYNSSDEAACVGGFTSVNKNNNFMYVVLPWNQTPLASSCDPTAHLLAGTQTYEGGIPEEIGTTFNHVAAYGKLTITNVTGTISSVAITSSEPLAGKSVKYYYSEGSLSGVDKNTITLSADNVTNGVFWFGCAPADLSEGTLSVTVTTSDSKTYTKELAISGKKFKFTKGKVSAFSVDMAGVPEDVVDLGYTGTWAIISENTIDEKTSYYACPAYTSGNNIKAVELDGINGEKYVYSDIALLSSITMTLTKQIGGDYDGLYTIVDSEGNYLYAASSSANNMKSQNSPSVNAYWTITETDGTWSIVASKSTNRNVMRFNYNNGSPLFSCYESASNTAVKLCPLSDFKYIKLDASVSSVSTKAPTGISSVNGTTATLNGSYTVLHFEEGEDIITFGFDYWLTTSPGEITTVTATEADNGNYSYDISGLTKDSEYAVRAWAYVNTLDKVYGEIVNFTPVMQAVGTTCYTLDGTSITTLGALTYTGNAVTTKTDEGAALWEVKGNKGSTNPWIQLRQNTTPSYIKVTVPSTKKISKVVLTISNASNSSGGVNDISKHGYFTGTISINASQGSNAIGTGTGVNNSNTLEISVEGTNNAVWIEAGGACRIWNVVVETN